MSPGGVAAKHQADGVFQGGGAKGIALAGALQELADQTAHPDDYVAEWVNLAGTSAGAIVAAYLACGNSPAETAKLVVETDFSNFEDWGPGGAIIGGAINLATHHGLAHGQAFRDWFARVTEEKTFGDIAREERALKIIASDITRREMLVLPDALSNYQLTSAGPRIAPDDFLIADAVRMSMSIPYFFQPIELVHAETKLISTIVDGGVLSNFPVWIFDTGDHDPVRPTFGFKLVGGRSVGGGLEKVIRAFGWPVSMGVEIFHTATDAWDTYWVSHATRVRTFPISAGEVGTTDFKLSDEQKQKLLASGREAVSKFLLDWDRAQYVNTYGRSLAPPPSANPSRPDPSQPDPSQQDR